MKKFSFILLSCWCLGVRAAPIAANLFECRGAGISANYSVGSLIGNALTITIGKKTFSAANEELREQESVLGNLVTLTTASVPDAFIDTLTVVLPDVNVPAFGDSVEFTTRLVKTRSNTSIAGPQFVNGVVQENLSRLLFCKASAVAF